MGLDDRLFYLFLGMAIGIVLGRFSRSLDVIKEELDEVDDIVKTELRHDRKTNESGAIHHPFVQYVSLLIVIVLTAWAAFASQNASNDVKDTQDKLSQVTFCNQQYLSKTINALNERTEFAKEQALKNVELQQAQAKFFDLLLHRPPYSENRRYLASKKYAATLHEFIDVNTKTAGKIDRNPYPTLDELRSCLAEAKK